MSSRHCTVKPCLEKRKGSKEARRKEGRKEKGMKEGRERKEGSKEEFCLYSEPRSVISRYSHSMRCLLRSVLWGRKAFNFDKDQSVYFPCVVTGSISRKVLAGPRSHRSGLLSRDLNVPAVRPRYAVHAALTFVSVWFTHRLRLSRHHFLKSLSLSH